jgi:hypothetical protein
VLAKHGKGSKLRPADASSEFPAYLEFLHFAESTAMAKIITDVTPTSRSRSTHPLVGRSRCEGRDSPQCRRNHEVASTTPQ